MMNFLNDYVVFDLETTGLDPKKNKIIEIGAAKVRGGKIIDTFETLVNPGWKLEEKITNITGITDDMLVNQPGIMEVIPKFLDFVEDDVLMGHSVMFDYSFAKRAVVNYDKKNGFTYKGIDTLKIARKYLSDLPSRGLVALCQHYEIKHDAHRALNDAIATHELYQKLITEFCINDENAKDFESVDLVYHVKREGSIMQKQKERLYRLLEQHKIEPEYDVEKLTKNEASRIIDQIISKYGRV